MMSVNSVSNSYIQPRGPRIDTNNDKAIDLNELKSLSEAQTERTGSTTFDAEEVMKTYDQNEDGLIDQAEGKSMRDDNGLNLPPLKEVQAQMMNSRPPRKPKPTEDTSQDISQLLETLSSDSSYADAEIAAYDLNGDGTIDAIEAAAMELLDNTEDNTLSSIFQRALEAYGKQDNAYSENNLQELTL